MTYPAYTDKTMADIIFDFAVVRGDLGEEYARDQLIEIIEDRIYTYRKQFVDLLYWVDRLTLVMEEYPEAQKHIALNYSPLLWVLDHLREARFATKAPL